MQTAEQETENPFSSAGTYSQAAIDLMRAMSAHRRRTGQQVSSRSDVLSIIGAIGFQPAGPRLSQADEERQFTTALGQYLAAANRTHPTCEDIISVVRSLGYQRAIADTRTYIPGVPIDRRRREADGRIQPTERRSCLEPSPQELLELTDEEHQFLNRLKTLRDETGREFASSEEILGIVWSLGYRPLNEEGLPVHWLDDDARCRAQTALTCAIESRQVENGDGEFLTCRDLLQSVLSIGFVRR